MRLADFERFERGSVAWFFRLFGAALVANVATELWAGVYEVHAGTLYPWRHLPIVPLYPPWALVVEWALTAGAGLALVAGCRRALAVRVAALATFSGVLQRYSNHGALLFLIALFVALEPPDLGAADFEARAWPSLGLVRAELFIVYFASALNKVTHGFLSGASLANLLGYAPATARALSFAVVASEIAIPLVLLWRPRAGFALVVAMHVAFASQIAGLWSFSLAMTAMAALFLPRALSRRSAADRAAPTA